MPLVRIDVIKGNPCDYRRAIGDVVERQESYLEVPCGKTPRR
jgi:hypothetical protein